MSSSAEALCFVIMPYGQPFDRYYDKIFVPAVSEAGLKPLRADSLFRPSPIMADVWKLTQDATVLLADLSTRNPNVFYEMGLAHAIGKPIVLVTNSADDVPFDLKGLRYILYDKDDEDWGSSLKGKIVLALRETLNDPKYAIPGMFLERSKVERPSESPLRQEIRELREEVRAMRNIRPDDSWKRRRASGVSIDYIVREVARKNGASIAKLATAPKSGDAREVIGLLARGEDDEALRLLRLDFALPELDAVNAAVAIIGEIDQIVAKEMNDPR